MAVDNGRIPKGRLPALLKAFLELANASGALQNNGSGVLSWATASSRAVGEYIVTGSPNLPPLSVWGNGQNLSRTTYSALFAEYGTTYGSGDGSTTFGTPDLRGRVVIGKDNMGGTAANRITNALSGITGTTLGAVGGSETHTLTTTEMPAHSHGVNNDSAGDFLTAYRASSTPGGAGTYSNVSTNSAGGGGAHRNVQPSIVGNIAIYAGV